MRIPDALKEQACSWSSKLIGTIVRRNVPITLRNVVEYVFTTRGDPPMLPIYEISGIEKRRNRELR